METKTILRALAALSQETRLAVFRLLVEHAPEGVSAGQIAETLNVAPATLSFHLKELSYADLIEPTHDGRFIWYTANLTTMNGLVGYLTENCCRASSVCDGKCLPKQKPIAEALPSRPKRKRTA